MAKQREGSLNCLLQLQQALDVPWVTIFVKKADTKV